MKFCEALRDGKSEYGIPDRIVEAHLSTLYFFGERVLKHYRKQKHFFADLETFETRKKFYEEDFFWNNAASPEVYVHFWGTTEKDGEQALVPPSIGEDFLIEMIKIDDKSTLSRVLQAGALTDDMAVSFVDTLVDTIATLTRERQQELAPLFAQGLHAVTKADMKSLSNWLGDCPHIPDEDAKEVVEVLCQAVHTLPYFSEKSDIKPVAAFDNNLENLLILNDRPSFIDILPPMDIWRAADEYATISRTVVDIEVLQGSASANVARKAYEKYGRMPETAVQLTYEVRASAIQWAGRCYNSRQDLAERYETYTREKVALLKKELASLTK